MSSQRASTATLPTTVRLAGALVTLEGAVALVVAVVLIVRALLGHDQQQASGYATAAWFILLGGTVFLAGLALSTGRRGGRSVGVVAQLLFLPVAWTLLTGSHQPWWGTLLGILAVVTLGALMAPATSRWMTGD